MHEIWPPLSQLDFKGRDIQRQIMPTYLHMYKLWSSPASQSDNVSTLKMKQNFGFKMMARFCQVLALLGSIAGYFLKLLSGSNKRIVKKYSFNAVSAVTKEWRSALLP
jgi:hypothetical protein